MIHTEGVPLASQHVQWLIFEFGNLSAHVIYGAHSVTVLLKSKYEYDALVAVSELKSISAIGATVDSPLSA